MPVAVKYLPAFHVAFIRHIQGYNKGEANAQIGVCFQRVCSWAAAHELLGPQTITIGIPYDDPTITPADRCRYDACVTVPENISAGSGEIGIQNIPEGRYAVVHFELSAQETGKIGAAVDALYGEWLPASGYTAADRPPLEIYYYSPDHPAGEWISMDFCLPVEPL